MSLSDQMALDASVFLNADDFAVEVSCVQGDGEPQAIVVLFSESSALQSGRMPIIRGEAEMVCAVADLARLSGGEKFTLPDGRVFTYHASNTKQSDGVYHRFTVSADPVPTLRRN